MRDGDERPGDVVARHEIDVAELAIVDAGSVAPVVYHVPMPEVRPEGPNFARSFGGELLARTLLWDPHATQEMTWQYAKMAAETITDRFRAGGIESGFDRHDRVAGWRAAFYWALIARDPEAMNEVASYPVERLRETSGQAFDEFQYEWARILQEAWRFGPETVGERAWALDTTSRVGAQPSVDALLRPGIEVLTRFAARDGDGFLWELGKALRAHRSFFDTDTWRHDPEGVFSLPLLGLACWASDLGLRIDIESEYLPLGFVRQPGWSQALSVGDDGGVLTEGE
ncbi:immunity 49 family protein [Nocardia sp. NBC_01503]|uniref:immunity 49 family protein n=1 Tax=Nocardia sp. NBC_01503 TaxID=2975997 RepID=UPI002E7B275D|nr:immunity 49 family protein [Nocardia sp. NBC_01503]WTL29380.1 immunity 49 family protein [Nocardia sp. NBC_01503]